MRRSTIRMIILLATVIFIGLVATQIFWVDKAYRITYIQITHEIEQALVHVAQDMQRHQGDSTFLVDPVNNVSRNFYRVQVNEEPDPFYLENMLRTEFLNRELNFRFQYSIYNCFNDSVVFTKTISHDADSATSAMLAPTILWEDDGHYFSVFFPTLQYEVFDQMGLWVASSTVLVVVLLFFAYVISIILKQKRLSEVKNDFINNMTHELKTPISTIALSSEVLLEDGMGNNPERLKNYARIIKSENQRLQTQVERVLQIARLDKEGVALNLSTVNLHDVIEAAVPTIAMNFEDKEVRISTELNAQSNEIEADEMHVTNIVYNLLDNAAKYGGDSPEITVKTSSDNHGITLVVQDKGPGISKEHQKLIFEKFYRIPTGNVHDIKGFGIGLHYVKSMCEAHHGKVKLTSKPGEGASFSIFLPFKQPHQTKAS